MVVCCKTSKLKQGIKYDDTEVVNNDGDHGTNEQNGKVALRKGYHRIRVICFDSGGGNSLKVMMQSEKGIKKEHHPLYTMQNNFCRAL